MKGSNTRRGKTQNNWVGQVIPDNKMNCHAEKFLFSISTFLNNQGRDPEQRRLRMTLLNKAAFTLIELLVVVLIIGILAAIALPQYQKAVLKSRYGGLMLTAKAVADGNELYYLTQNKYADSVGDLDVRVSNATGEMSVNVVGGSDEDYAYTIATRPDIKNNYIIYQKHSENYPGEIHCEAEDNNAHAQWVCETAYHGTKIEDNTLTSGYTLYVLNGNGVKTTVSDGESGASGADEPGSNVPEGPKWNGTNMLQSTYDLMSFFYKYNNGAGDDFDDDNISVENGRLEYVDANTLKIDGQFYTYDPVTNSITAPYHEIWKRIWYGEKNTKLAIAHSYDQGQTWECLMGNC